MEQIFHLRHYSTLKIISLSVKKFRLNTIKILLGNPVNLIKWIKSPGKVFRKEMYDKLCISYFRQYKCDIYHFGYSGTAITYLSLFDYLPGKKVVSCLGTAENVKPLSEPLRIKKLNLLFQKVDKIHCVSQRMQKTIEEYNAPSEKIFINRPAIDTAVFTRKEIYRNTETIHILSIGRLVFQKGFLIGMLAIAELIKKFDNFIWTIVGEGPEREELIFYIHHFKLEKNVILAGKKTRNEVLEIYQTTDISFLPSVSEGIANVILEAMSMEIPVIASKSGGIEEVINHSVNGILCKNYDFTGMAHELLQLCTNVELRRSLGHMGRITIEENYSIKRYIDVFENEYHILLNKQNLS